MSHPIARMLGICDPATTAVINIIPLQTHSPAMTTNPSSQQPQSATVKIISYTPDKDPETESALAKLARRSHPSIKASEREAMEAHGNLDEDYLFVTLPDAGSGHNAGLKRAADLLLNVFGLSEEDAIDHLGSIYERDIADVHRAIQRVRDGVTSESSSKLPKADNRLISAVERQSKKTTAILIEQSPCSLDATAYDVIRFLMRNGEGEDPLVCIGSAKDRFSTKPLSAFKSSAHKFPFIVPQAMTALQGRTQEGHLSAKCNANTSERSNQVVEFDNLPKDTQASLLLFLSDYVPLLCVCDSGGKSLHGYFDVDGRTHEEKERFMRIACKLGADKALWTLSQFARIPGGTRPADDDEGTPARHQELLYLDTDSPGKHWRLDELEARLERFENESGSEKLRAMLATRAFNFEVVPPKPRPILKLGDKILWTPGNVNSLQGGVKTGKTAVLESILAALFICNNRQGQDTLGFIAENPDGKAVIHLDTEQSSYDHDSLIRRAMRRAGTATPPPWLYSYFFGDLSVGDRLAALTLSIEDASNTHGGIFAVLIDGVADLCHDPNDTKEAFALVEHLRTIAYRFNCSVFTVLHENPGSENGKMRGHLGSQLERKAETPIRLAKDASSGITTIWSDRARHNHIPREQGSCFSWSDEFQMHVSRGSSREIKASEKTVKSRDEALTAFGDTSSLSYSDLVARIVEKIGIAKKTAETRVKTFATTGIIEKKSDGQYSIRPIDEDV